MMAIITVISVRKSSIPKPLTIDPRALIITHHQLVKGGRDGSQRKCFAILPNGSKCGKKTRNYCEQCGHIPLCEGLCSTVYYNPFTQISLQ